MAHSVETSARTLFSQLREDLDRAERLVVQVDATTVSDFLALLDRIEAQFDALSADEFDLRPEQSRWDNLLRRVNSQPGAIVRTANAAGGMDKLRAAHPPAESFWWHLDKEVMRRRVRSIRQLVTTLVTVVVLAVGGYWAINYFFPPDPAAVLMVETNSSLDRLITEQRWQEALDLVKTTRAQLPDNVELMVWEVVLNERLGNSEAAAAARAEAEAALANDPIQVLLYLGNQRLQVGDLDGASAAADEAQQFDPNNAQVYFLLGGIAETRGDVPLAISYFDQTSQLAEESNPQLAVIAKVRMGNLLQNAGSIVTSEAVTPKSVTPEAVTPEAAPTATP